MRHTTNDKTLMINYLKRFRFLINEYKLVKAKQHPQFRFVTDFYKFHDTNRQTFLKYYNRFVLTLKDNDLLPRRRGPKWHSRKPMLFIENKVIELRKKGQNKYEISANLKPYLKRFTPSPSGVYNICKRYNLNKLNPKMKEEKKKIIRKKAGELAHIDCHYLAKDIVANVNTRLYLVGMIDDATRLVWLEVVPDIKNLTVMFASLRLFNYFQSEYGFKFEEILSDNGVEFGGKILKNPEENPFERMLLEMGIKHRYTRPYRPQTNGKIERFWKTLEEDVLEDMVFDSLDHLNDELSQYLYYYNNHRPHQGINGETPLAFFKKLSTN